MQEMMISYIWDIFIWNRVYYKTHIYMGAEIEMGSIIILWLL